jgi:hypothetical protein
MAVDDAGNNVGEVAVRLDAKELAGEIAQRRLRAEREACGVETSTERPNAPL